MKNKKRSIWQFTPVKVLAASMAAVMLLTIGVGALNGWDYAKVFGGVFGGDSDIELAHEIKPRVVNLLNTNQDDIIQAGDTTIEVLGVAGDDKVLFTVFEFTGKKPRFTGGRTGGNDLFLVGYSHDTDFTGGYSSTKTLSETDDSITIAFVYEFSHPNFTLQKGYASFKYSEYENSFDENGENIGGKTIDEITFDVEVDYDFSAKKAFEVNQISTIPTIGGSSGKSNVDVLLKTVEITPIAVRYTTDSPDFDGETDFKMTFSAEAVLVTFKNGDTMSFDGD